VSDLTEILTASVLEAFRTKQPLRIVGGDSKAFYGREISDEPLRIGEHKDVVSYEPTELVITARAGTPLRELESVLAAQGQMLPFEPPAFGESATLGGTIACNLSGPRRPYLGSARDFVLGCRIINGRGEAMHFGGEVMKNVAGYDVSRLQCGAMGTLGVLLEISLKVLPRPEAELTLIQQCSGDEAIDTMNRLGGQPLPLSAACHDGENLYIRLSGTEAGINAARARVGGDEYAEGKTFWKELKEHELPFFGNDLPLWRVSLPPAAAMLNIPGKKILDWGGGQRWIHSEEAAQRIRGIAAKAGGHATLFRTGSSNGNGEQPFHPLDKGLMMLHQRLKQSFDPHGVLNPGRMYREI
jgi:glycolate oxidase FAD binding subunit